MVDSLDDEELNRLVGILDLSKVKSKTEFWEEFWWQFKKKGSKALGSELLKHVEDEVGDLPREPKYRVTYHYKGIKFRRNIVMRRNKHVTINRDVKTGRFVRVR